jgi:hypothetical protein
MNVHAGKSNGFNRNNIKALWDRATKQRTTTWLLKAWTQEEVLVSTQQLPQDLFTGTLLVDGLTGTERPTTNTQLLFDVTHNLCNIGTDKCIVF